MGCAGQDSVLFTGGPGATADGSFRLTTLFALSGPSGEKAGGYVSMEVAIDTPPTAYTQLAGPVSCLAVTGSRAILNFEDQIHDLGVITVTVVDGNPDSFGAQPTGLSGRAPRDCSPPSPDEALALTSGHISIVDSQPAPIAK